MAVKIPKEIRSARAKIGHLRKVQRILEKYKDGPQDKCVGLYNGVCICGHCTCLHAPVAPGVLYYGQCERCDCPVFEGHLLDLPEAEYQKALTDRATLKLLIGDGTLPKLLTYADLEKHRAFNQSKQ